MSTQVNPGVTRMNGTTRRKPRTAVMLGLLVLAAGSAAAQAEFAYFGSAGPAFWGRLDPAWEACGSGREQSPIDFGKHTVLTALHRQPGAHRCRRGDERGHDAVADGFDHRALFG